MSWTFDIAALFTIGFLVFLGLRFTKLSEQAFASQSGMGESFDVRKKMVLPYPRKLIRQSGLSPDDNLMIYWVSKLLLAVLLPLVAAEIHSLMVQFPYPLVLGIAGFFIPDLWLMSRRKKRRERIENGLSFLIDLIVAFLKSGMTLTQAFDQAAEHALPAKHPLAREAALIASELEAGIDRSAAFQNLADRTGVDALYRLSAVLTVGLKSGSPVHNTLRSQADLLRARQRERGEELISKKTLQALLPMVLVSFPLIGVLVFFPAGLQLYEVFLLFRETIL